MSQRVLAFFDLLDGSAVRESIRQMILGFGSISETETESLCDSVDQRLRSIRSSLQDVCYEDDMSEAEAMLPWVWLELRFEWMRLNAQMQYQTVMQGTADPSLMARGAALSAIIEGVERQLDATQIYTVTRIAADPAGVALAAVARTERLFSVMQDAGVGGRNAVESLLTAQEKMTRVSDGGMVRQEMTEAISDVMQKVGDALQVTTEDFSLALQGVLLRELGQASILVVLEDANNHAETRLPSAVAIGLLRAASHWMAAIKTTSLSVGAEERIRLERPPYVTISWSLRSEREHVVLELKDDADGTVAFLPNVREWPIQDLFTETHNEPGHGSALKLRCQVTTLSDYLMLRVGGGDHDVIVGVPTLSVLHIERRDASALAVRGSRLINRLHGGAHPLIDLGDALFDCPADEEEATYVHVRTGEGDDDVLALRVRGVQGICHGSMKAVPAALRPVPLRGFVMTGQDIVAVLDVKETVRRFHLKHEATEVPDTLVEASEIAA